MEEQYWRKCGPCKKPIAFNSRYYQCSIAACRKHVFCSKDCFIAHSSMMRHKEAWPEDFTAPLTPQQDTQNPGNSRKIVASSPVTQPGTRSEQDPIPQEILIVASKLKAYIKSQSGMNTSASVMDRLSDLVRILCDQAIIQAQNDSRKTVMDRDFNFKI